MPVCIHTHAHMYIHKHIHTDGHIRNYKFTYFINASIYIYIYLCHCSSENRALFKGELFDLLIISFSSTLGDTIRSLMALDEFVFYEITQFHH